MTMSNEADYDALEKSVKYIPWKGKKEAQDIFGQGNDTRISWCIGRIGGSSN